ncbi:F-box/kelch-repeat protein At3g06240-like [Rutidosis leptorrhynchoides]|uniref:F-box/kelch-repeat protein At3g06240-like n=1 Tax=Rutidosis leptorrhynchoides TaxID=125765 RepID=UPI003A9988ED
MSDSNNPNSALNHLPQDLFEAILHLLPFKSIGSLKSVSKRWCSMISSPQFIKTHIRNFIKNNPNPNPTHLILDEEAGDIIYSVDIKQLNTQPTPATLIAKRLNLQELLFEILGSCNGLLLTNDIHHNLYLVNPTTRKTLKVPVGKSIDGTYRFGYDSSTDDYKVISISRLSISDSDPDTKFVRVYSLRNNSWNVLPNVSYKHDYYGLGVLLNNNLHWVVKSSRRSTMTIAAFSLASEEFHEIEFPDSVNYMFSSLCALGGKLVAVLQCDEFVSELWVMEEYGVPMSWKKLCTLDMDLNDEFFAQVSNRDILLGNNYANEIVMYNTDERRSTRVTIEGCRERFRVFATYVESLESPERFR